MNDQFALHELIGLLSQRHQMKQADAEAFVQTFFALIKETLVTDKYVKVKGLGTFKLIDARESIEANADEAVGMQAHLQISFTPDASMRDAVNKPFNHFETILLNETTHYDDIPEEVSSQACQVANNMTESVKTDAPARRDISIEEKQPTNEEAILKDNSHRNSAYLRLPWCLIASVLLVGILIGGGIAWGLLSGRRYIPESVIQILTEEKEEAEVIDTASAVVPSDTFRSPARDRNEVVLPTVLSDSVRYDIQGTLTTHTLRRGESLARLAERYYGNRNLWTYLARYNRNRIKDANDIPVGTLIHIPKLVPKE